MREPWPHTRPTARAVLSAAAGLALALAAGSARAGSARDAARDLDGLLAALAQPGAPAVRAGAPNGGRLAAHVQRLEAQYAREIAAFDAAGQRQLPPKGGARLAAARAAHAEGQGRLVALLRSLAGSRAASPDVETAAQEARDILARLEAVARPEPLSTELKVRAPAVEALPLPTGIGRTTEPEAASMGPVPPPVRALATSLAGPIEAYAWVRNNVRPEFYWGSLKGPLQTLHDKSGNDADTAALLIALLRAQGFPARFVQGTVQVPAHRLQSVTGTASPEQAVRVLDRAGVPYEAVLGGSGVVAVKLGRVWAEAYVPYANYRGLPADQQGKLWLPLDPGFKDLRAPGGHDVVNEFGFDPRGLLDDYLAVPRAETPLAFARTRVNQLVAPQNLTYSEVLTDRAVVPEDLGILPNALPYAVLGATDASYDAPLPHELRVVGQASDGRVVLDATLPLADVIGRRLTLSYVPFDADDAAVVASYGGLTRTPPYLFEVKPLLKLGGVPVALGEGPLGMAVRYDLRVELTFPSGHEEVHNRVLAGNLTALGLAGGEWGGDEDQESHAAALLARAAFDYLKRWNRSDTELASLLRVVAVRPTASACFVMSDVEVEYAGGDPLYPISFDWKGVAIDADLRPAAPVGIEEAAQQARFALLSGLEGSILEGRLFEEMWDVGSLSTAKALQLAAGQGRTVLTLTRDDVDAVLPGLPLDEGVKAEIRDAALRGYEVRVPDGPVGLLAWTGSGWWVLDPATGESAWQLQGGHSGGVTAAPVSGWPSAPLVETLVDQGEEPAPEGSQVAKILKFVSTDFQEGLVNQPLARPFRVLALNSEGQRVAGAPVTFRVLGGGGSFLDPATGLPNGAPFLTVLANARGEAEATLVLGKTTSEIPRFVCLEPDPESCSAEDEIWATQVGLNLVAVAAGTAQTPEPFSAYGKPDDQFDGVNRHARLSFKALPSGANVANLGVAGLLALNVRDPHGNPLSNFPVRFSYRPPPVLGDPPSGWQLTRPATETPGKILRLQDYQRCVESNPSPGWGECPGEVEQAEVRSSSYGSLAYLVLGDSPYSRYYFDIGTETRPDWGWIGIGTWGLLCSGSCPEAYRQWPITLVDVDTRPVLVGPTGNLIEAYAPGDTARMAVSVNALYEGYQVEPFVDEDGNKRFHVRGTNQWSREPLGDSVFTLTPRTAGTGAPAQADYAGNGVYEAPMTMAPTPQLNTVDFEVRSTPWLIPPFLPDHPDEVDPSAVDEVTLEIAKRKYPDKPGLRSGSSSFWGVRAVLPGLDPTPLRVEAGRVAQRAVVQHDVQPAEYLAELAPTNLWFTVSRNDQTVLAGAGADGAPFEVPQGLSLPSGEYTAQLSIPSVSEGGGGIESERLPVPVCQPLELLTPLVALPLDPGGQSACEIQDRIRFEVCARSAVTLTLAGAPLTARVDGVVATLQDLELGAGEHVVEVPRDLVESFQQPQVPFLVRAVELDAPGGAREVPGVVSISDELISLVTPEVKLALTLDPANGLVCTDQEDLRFVVCDAARVSIKLDGGSILAGGIDGGPIVSLDGLSLAAGPHTVRLPPGLLSDSFEQARGFRVEAQSLSDSSLTDTADGVLLGARVNRPVLAVGHTLVKGVDLFDGHLVRQETDLSLPGRHLGLEVARTYSSSGRSMEGVMGAGWNWSYGLSLHEAREEGCGRVTLTTRDSTQVFAPGAAGQPYQPQKGYHGRLVRIDQVTFDYFDKANVQHHFVQQGLDPNDYRIEWIREPHGDRLAFDYDLSGRLTRVVQEQDGSPVHELRLSYTKAGGYDRIARAEIVQAGGVGLGLAVDYSFDPTWGNLESATRTPANLGSGPPAPERRQRYTYSLASQRDRHQLTEVVDANDHTTRYDYYTLTDSLPGENDGGLVFFDKEERVKAVHDFPDERDLATRFSYDLTEALDLRWKTTVEDPAGRSVLYVQNGDGSTAEVREPLGKTTVTFWNADVRKDREQDGEGRWTRFGWDGRGNPTFETVETGDPDLGDVTTTTAYDATFSKLTSRIDGEENTTTWTLSPVNGDVLTMTDGEGNLTTYEYDGGASDGPGLLTRTVDPRGQATTYEQHDGFGQPRRIVDPLGNWTQREYDPRGRLALETDSFGRRTTYLYDGLDRVRELRREAGSAGGASDDELTTRDYYPDGQLRTETKRVSSGESVTTKHTLDGMNRVVVTEITLPGQRLESRNHYDDAGNKDRETDLRGVQRQLEYDELNRLVKVRILDGPAATPMGEVASFDYDKVGNKLWEKDVAGLQTDFSYDGLYRVKARQLPATMPAGYQPTGRLTETFHYDRVGKLLSQKDANGHETRNQYDRNNRLTSTVVDPDGLALTTTTRYCNAPAPDPPDGTGINRCEVLESPKGLRTVFEFDELNRETRRTVRLEGPDGEPAVDEYATETDYDDAQHALRVKDPNGNVTLTELDGLDRPVRQVVDEGRLNLETRTSFDGLGNKKQVVDPRGNSTRFRYDGLGRLRRQTDPYNRSASFSYDGGGLKTFEEDRRNVQRRHSYDNLGRLLRSELVSAPFSGVGWHHTIQYLDAERQRVEFDARDKRTTYGLDGLGRVIEEKDDRGKSAFATWDGVNKRRQTDKRPEHHASDYEYDAANRLTRTLDPPVDGVRYELQTHYLDGANQVEEVDRRGIVKTTQLDSLGRVCSVTRAAGFPEAAVLERNTYDGNGNKTVAIDAEDRRTEFDYDGANRLTDRRDGVATPVEARTHFEYDESGNLEIEQDQRARDAGQPFSVKRFYDRLNRVWREYDGEGDLTVYLYDAEGNRESVEDPRRYVTRFAYDELGKLTRVAQPRVAAGVPETRYEYDPNRNRTRQIDARQHAVEMQYDELNRLEWTIQEGNLRTHHEYDENGNETALTDPNGHVVHSTYDELNRLRVKTFDYAASLELPWRRTLRAEYDYDPNGNLTEIRDDVASGADPPSGTARLTTQREYDRQDRLQTETAQTPEGQTPTVRYSYWPNGLRRSVTDSAGFVTQYEYDGKNRLATAKASAGTSDERTTTYGYWPDDLVRDVTMSNGVKAGYLYDRADRQTRLTNLHGPTVISSYAYGYDPSGNRLSQLEVNGGLTENTGYTYDELNRLERVTYPADATHPTGRTVAYGYDLVGNRVAENEDAGDGAPISHKAATFDGLNRLTALDDTVDDSNDATFGYDDNGNLRSKTAGGVTSTYVYDAQDRLSEARDSAHGTAPLARFQYDAQGRRTLKLGDPTAAGDSGTRQFVYDQTSVLQELASDGSTIAKYEWGLGRLISLDRGAGGALERRYYSLDALGSVVNLTDQAGVPSASYHLDAWGNYRFPSELGGSGNRFGFTGHYFDTETQLYYAKARYFDPQLGRFLTQDSYLGELTEPPSLHRYLYAADRPTYYVDPDGNESVRQWWGLDRPDTFWSAFGKNLAYNTWNAISFGTLGRQDKLVEMSEAGQITEAQYWGRTAINAGSGVVIAGATAASGGFAGGAGSALAGRLGAGVVIEGLVTGASAGFGAGVGGAIASDVIEVSGTGTKQSQEVDPGSWLTAGGVGALIGGPLGAAGGLGANLNPSIGPLQFLDRTPVGSATSTLGGAFEGLAARSAEAGRVVEGRAAGLLDRGGELRVPSYETPHQPLSRSGRAALREKIADRTMTRDEYERFDWDRRFANRRARGVDRFFANERQLLRSGGRGTRNWSAQQRSEVLGGGRPTFGGRPIEGHHRFNALDYPQLADDPATIYPATRGEHFYRWHGGNWRNDTAGSPLNPFSPEDFGSSVPPGALWWLGGAASEPGR